MCVLWSTITDCTLSAFTKTAGRDENYYLLLVVLLTNIHFFSMFSFSQIVYFYTEFLVFFSSLCSQKYCRCTVFSRNIFLLCLKGHVLSRQSKLLPKMFVDKGSLVSSVVWFPLQICTKLSVNKILCRFY